MRVRPKMNYHLLGTEIKLDKTKVYEAEEARNQPYYKERGLVFVEGVLLARNEYTKVL